MATAASQSVPRSSAAAQVSGATQANAWQWFWDFLKEELAPYPGRGDMVIRTVVAATLVMIVCETIRVPFAWQGAIYAFLVSRESAKATLQSVTTILVVTVVSAAYCLVSVSFVVSSPWLHFFWVICSLFLGFYAVSVSTNYTAAVIFVNMISAEVPLWDQHMPAEFNVERTIWLCFATLIAVAITAAVELTFSLIEPEDGIIAGVAQRMAAIETLLAAYAENRSIDSLTEAALARLEMVGSSGLRRNLKRSGYPQHYAEQMGAVIALAGRLVDLAAVLRISRFTLADHDRRRLHELGENIAAIRSDLLAGRTPELKRLFSSANASDAAPLLGEMEQTVAFIPEAFAASASLSIYAPPPDSGDPPRTLLVRDAFKNIEHVKFAAKGCLTAALCYFIYNAIDWPGISTAVTTCLLTALSTTGSSRQKQVLRISGAAAGGFLLGMGSQIFILPYLDSIAGFTILFIFVTALASWIGTSSSRLSYLGIQIALAFYLINLEEFAVRTSLAVARDRVVGILLGLIMMWLVFDQLGGASAIVNMKKAFISAIRLLAQFAREPLSSDYQLAIDRSYSLREQINQGFDSVRAAADGVLFEFGPSRNQDLAWRSKIKEWQPQLRSLFLIRIALWKYRMQLPGFQLPPAVSSAQQRFDSQSADLLDRIADRMEGQESGQPTNLTESFRRLEKAAEESAPAASRGPLPELQTFLLLSRKAESLESSLNQAIEQHV